MNSANVEKNIALAPDKSQVLWWQFCQQSLHDVIEEFFGDMSIEEIPSLLQSDNDYEKQVAHRVKSVGLDKSMVETCKQISKFIKKKNEDKELYRRGLKNYKTAKRRQKIKNCQKEQIQSPPTELSLGFQKTESRKEVI